MFPQPQQPGYFGGLNEALLEAVPASAMTVVEAGCAEGRLGEALRRRVPGRTVIGIEIDAAVAELARSRLDDVLVHDLMSGPPPLEAGTVDVITFGDVLEHVVDPEAVLGSVRNLLAPGGRVLASIPNVGHYSVLSAVLRGDFMYQPMGLLDATHLRFFTYATIFKLFLDAGYVPRISGISGIKEAPITERRLQSLVPVLLDQRVDPEHARRHLSAFQYIIEAVVAPPVPSGYAAPMTFACIVTDNDRLESNLKRSPVFDPGSPHQFISLQNQPSVAAGLKTALAEANHDIVILVDENAYLPRGWDQAFRASWAEATTKFGPLGIAGVVGKHWDGTVPSAQFGRAIVRDQLIDSQERLPARADVLDEFLLALPRDTPLRPDESLGLHLCGLDLVLQAREKNLPVVVLNALCLHNSLARPADAGLAHSRERLSDKWARQEPSWPALKAACEEALPPPQLAYWPAALRQDLREAKRSVVAAQKNAKAARMKLREQKERANRAEKELAKLKSSRTWRTRSRLASAGRKLRPSARLRRKVS